MPEIENLIVGYTGPVVSPENLEQVASKIYNDMPKSAPSAFSITKLGSISGTSNMPSSKMTVTAPMFAPSILLANANNTPYSGIWILNPLLGPNVTQLFTNSTNPYTVEYDEGPMFTIGCSMSTSTDVYLITFNLEE